MFIFTKEGKPKPLNSRPNYKMFYNGKQQKMKLKIEDLKIENFVTALDKDLSKNFKVV